MSYDLLRNQDSAGHTVAGEAAAQRVAATLVAASVEFHVEPLPDDVWDFHIKNEKAAWKVLIDAVVAENQY